MCFVAPVTPNGDATFAQSSETLLARRGVAAKYA